MKKILLAVTALLFVGTVANAQVQGNAIGLRLGYGVDLSYQHALSNSNRLEFNLGLNGLKFDPLVLSLSGVYQTVYNIESVQGLNWYWGYGVSLGIYGKNFQVGIIGDIGIEYNFVNVPIGLSLDWRPGLYYTTGINEIAFGWEGFSLGVRYRF